MYRLSLGLGVLAVLALSAAASAEQRLHRDGKRVEKTIRIKMPKQQIGSPNACKANVHLRYGQRGERARVDTEIENDDCGASSGSYEVQIRITDANGDRQRLTFTENWARDDDAPVETRHFYDIGPDATLRSIKPKPLSCECAAAPDSAEASG